MVPVSCSCEVFIEDCSKICSTTSVEGYSAIKSKSSWPGDDDKREKGLEWSMGKSIKRSSACSSRVGTEAGRGTNGRSVDLKEDRHRLGRAVVSRCYRFLLFQRSLQANSDGFIVTTTVNASSHGAERRADLRIKYGATIG